MSSKSLKFTYYLVYVKRYFIWAGFKTLISFGNIETVMPACIDKPIVNHMVSFIFGDQNVFVPSRK